MDASERRSRAAEEAADWWIRLQTDQISKPEREQFVDWLRESAVHVAEMLRVAQVHNSLEQFEQWSRIATDGPIEDENVVPLGKSPSPPPSAARDFGKGRRRFLAIAASFAMVGLAAGWFLLQMRGQVIDTERGERREVALSDGSVLQVDPETRLRVEFEDDQRRVILENGRTLFRVAKNPERPFLVESEGTVVRAVGTAFGVEQRGRGVVVTVAEGKVSVAPLSLETREALAVPTAPRETGASSQGSPATEPVPDSSEPDEVFLTAGEQLTVQRSGSTEPVRKVDSTRELAWAQGRLVFENDSVAAVAEEFNRYNRVQIRVTDTALANRPVSGTFDASDPESFIAFVQTVAPVQVSRGDSEEITIEGR